MENVKSWEVDGDSLTIKIFDKVSTKDLSDIMNVVVKYERNHVTDYHTKYSYWNIETPITENNVVEIKKQ